MVKEHSFWTPAKMNRNIKVRPMKPVRLFGFGMNPKPSFNNYIKPRAPISPINLNIYPKRTKSEIRMIDRKPWSDSDRDKVPNYFDCKPLNKNKQAFLLRIRPKKGIKNKEKYMPQVQNIADRLFREKMIFEEQRREVERFKGDTYIRKRKQLEKEVQPLNVGLYDFMAIPGVKIPEGTIKEPDTDREMKEKPMDLIVEGGIIKGEVVTIKRGPDVKEIKSLYILPEYQKQGLGKKVVAAMFMNPKTKRIVGVSAAKSDPYWEKLGGGQKPVDIDLDKEQQEEIMKGIRPMLLEAGYNPRDISYENLHPNMKKTFPIGASFEIRKEEFLEKYPTALITKEKTSIEEEKKKGWGKKAFFIPKLPKLPSFISRDNDGEKAEIVKNIIEHKYTKEEVRDKIKIFNPDEKQSLFRTMRMLHNIKKEDRAKMNIKIPEKNFDIKTFERVVAKSKSYIDLPELEKQKQIRAAEEKWNMVLVAKQIRDNLGIPVSDKEMKHYINEYKKTGFEFGPINVSPEIKEKIIKLKEALNKIPVGEKSVPKFERKELEWGEFRDKFIKSKPKIEDKPHFTLSQRKTEEGDIIETRGAVLEPAAIKTEVYKAEVKLEKTPPVTFNEEKIKKGARETLQNISKEVEAEQKAIEKEERRMRKEEIDQLASEIKESKKQSKELNAVEELEKQSPAEDVVEKMIEEKESKSSFVSEALASMEKEPAIAKSMKESADLAKSGE